MLQYRLAGCRREDAVYRCASPTGKVQAATSSITHVLSFSNWPALGVALFVRINWQNGQCCILSGVRPDSCQCAPRLHCRSASQVMELLRLFS